MELEERTKKWIDQMTLCPGATAATIDAVEAFAGVTLPSQYKAFLAYSNGAEGSIGEQGYLVLYNSEEVINLNKNFSVSEAMPGFLKIGGDGGNVVYGVDTRSNSPEEMHFVETDLIGGMTWGTVFHEVFSFHELIYYAANQTIE